MKTMIDMPILPLASAKAWESWLGSNHTSSGGVWLQLFKQGSGRGTITHDEAVDVALCYGWIDGQAKSHDAESWLQKFTPRRPKSVWSKRNCERALRLIKWKKMKPAGMRQIEAARKDGRWERAYDSPKDMVIPSDFLDALARNKKAHAFFKTLNRTNLYSIAWRLQTAKKAETRERRMKAILAMMAKGEKFHP